MVVLGSRSVEMPVTPTLITHGLRECIPAKVGHGEVSKDLFLAWNGATWGEIEVCSVHCSYLLIARCSNLVFTVTTDAVGTVSSIGPGASSLLLRVEQLQPVRLSSI